MQQEINEEIMTIEDVLEHAKNNGEFGPSKDVGGKKVLRTTICFSPNTENNFKGGFPKGFIKWLKENGWWGKKRIHLCSGGVKDDEAIARVDIRPETNPTHCEDASNTSLPDGCADFVLIDPPYSKELAKLLYNTEPYYRRIDEFMKEGARLLEPNGLLCSLSYEIPRRPPNCQLIACVGVYQALQVSHMRCFTAWQKTR